MALWPEVGSDGGPAEHHGRVGPVEAQRSRWEREKVVEGFLVSVVLTRDLSEDGCDMMS